MTQFPCVTFREPDLRTCQIAGQHEPQCDGREYRWSNDAQDDLATGDGCTGCEPKPAIRGHVCGSCYGRIMRAFEDVPDWLRLTDGILTTARVETGGGSALGFVPFTALEMDRAEVVEMLDGATKDDVDRWVANPKGAADAVRVAAAIRVAIARHPVSVEQEDLDRARCPKCDRLTLVRVLPTKPKAEEVVKCRDWACAFKADADEVDMLVYREREMKRIPKEEPSPA